MRGEQLGRRVRNADEDHPEVQQRRHQREDRRLLTAVQAAGGHEDAGRLAFEFPLEPEGRELVRATPADGDRGSRGAGARARAEARYDPARPAPPGYGGGGRSPPGPRGGGGGAGG